MSHTVDGTRIWVTGASCGIGAALPASWSTAAHGSRSRPGEPIGSRR